MLSLIKPMYFQICNWPWKLIYTVRWCRFKNDICYYMWRYISPVVLQTTVSLRHLIKRSSCWGSDIMCHQWMLQWVCGYWCLCSAKTKKNRRAASFHVETWMKILCEYDKKGCDSVLNYFWQQQVFLQPGGAQQCLPLRDRYKPPSGAVSTLVLLPWTTDSWAYL